MSEPAPVPDHEPSIRPDPHHEDSLDDRSGAWVRIVVAGCALLLCAAVIGGFVWLLDAPVLVPVTGRVKFGDKSLKTGFVTAIPVRGGLAALSALDAEGNFDLMTNGVRGAYTGEHKLTVQAMTPGMPPKPIVPQEYADEWTTPLTMKVKKGESNHFEFEITEDESR
jgi:hypothetical protein